MQKSILKKVLILLGLVTMSLAVSGSIAFADDDAPPSLSIPGGSHSTGDGDAANLPADYEDYANEGNRTPPAEDAGQNTGSGTKKSTGGITKSGPELAILIPLSLLGGYLYKRNKK